MSDHTDADSFLWKYAYDDKGNVTQQTDPRGAVDTYSYNTGTNTMKSHVGVLGDTYQYTYDTGRNDKTVRDPYYTSQAFDHDAYGNITSATTPLGWADNLVDNSSFEDLNADGKTPLHFTASEGTTTSGALDTDAVYGAHSFQVTTVNDYSVWTSDAINVSTSSDYVLSGYLKAAQTSGAETTVLSVYAYDSNGTRLGEVGRMNLQNASASWQRWSTAIHPGDWPAGTASVRVKLAASNTTGAGSSSFDALQLQKNPVDTAYDLVDNSSFERGTTWPDHWSKNSSTGTYTWDASNVYAGGRALTVANATGYAGVTYGDLLPYDSSQSYSLTAFTSTSSLSANVAHIEIDQYDANQTLIGQTASVSLGSTNEWRRLSVELRSGAAAAGTAFIRPSLLSGTSTGSVTFDNVRFQMDHVTTDNQYDASNTWLTSGSDPLGNKTQYAYDSAGNLTQTTDPLGQVTTMTFDALDRLLSVTPPGGDIKTTNGYDADGNLTSITTSDPNSGTARNQVHFGYNSLGQTTTVIDPVGHQTHLTYTPAGRLQKISEPNAQSVSYSYDKADRLTDVLYNDKGRYHYTFDGRGNIKSVADRDQQRTWSAQYDALSRLVVWGDGSGSLTFTLDNAGNVTQQQLKLFSTTKTKTLTYDKVSQPATLTDDDGTSNFLYNEKGLASLLQAGNGTTERLSYDSDGRVTQVQNQTATGGVLSSYQYSYDANGNTKSVTDATGQALNYAYDVKGRLISETLASGNTVTYSYDALGNRTQRQEKQPDGTVVKTTTYAYDAANELTQLDNTPYTYDANGHLLSNGVYSYKWDAAGRLAEVDSQSDGSVLATYQYDDLNRRVKQTVNGQNTYYLYAGTSNHVVAEYDGLGTLKAYYN